VVRTPNLFPSGAGGAAAGVWANSKDASVMEAPGVWDGPFSSCADMMGGGEVEKGRQHTDMSVSMYMYAQLGLQAQQ
jgi:hypothetical protein